MQLLLPHCNGRAIVQAGLVEVRVAPPARGPETLALAPEPRPSAAKGPLLLRSGPPLRRWARRASMAVAVVLMRILDVRLSAALGL